MTAYFGTDGIRGLVGKPPITADFFLKLGWSVGCVLSQKYQNATVVIGKDPRISGYMLESALEAGFTASGTNVILVGPMPTPAVAFLTKTYNATAGAVISASHNPYQDNGIKFFSNQGVKLNDADQQAIEKMIHQKMMSVESKYIGKAKRADQAEGRYIEFCKSIIHKNLNLKGLKIVLDCANGATYHIAPLVFSELGGEVITIHNQPNGFNINKKCGATDMTSLQNKVLETKADLGLAFDGDGDRLMMVDEHGHIIDGDEILFIIAKHKKSQQQLKNNAVVGTKMTNIGIRQAFDAQNIDFYEADIGDRFVAKLMQAHHLILGGEGSGHIICQEHSNTGDAIIAALEVLSAIIKQKRSLYQLSQDYTKTIQQLTSISISQPLNSTQNQQLHTLNQTSNQQLSNQGRVLIRPSGTELIVRLMVESNDKEILEIYQTRLKQAIDKICC